MSQDDPTEPAEFREPMQRASVTVEPAAAGAQTGRQESRLLRFALAAATVAVLGTTAAFVWRTRYATDWRALQAVALQLDGRELLLEDGEHFELDEGSRLESGASTVRLRLDDRAVFELAPGTTLDLITLPARGAAATIEIFVTAGAMRVATTAGFVPTRMLISTPDATVHVQGTAFGIDVLPGEATCVCCTEGRVEAEITRGTGQLIAVDAGGSAWCPSGSEPAMLRPANLQHVAPIEALRVLQ